MNDGWGELIDRHMLEEAELSVRQKQELVDYLINVEKLPEDSPRLKTFRTKLLVAIDRLVMLREGAKR